MSDKQYNYNVRYAIVYEHRFNLYTLIITKKNDQHGLQGIVGFL
jgi:hypothetical protein